MKLNELREMIGQVLNELSEPYSASKERHRYVDGPGFKSSPPHAGSLEASPDILDTLEPGGSLVKARNVGEQPLNWKIMSATGTPPERLWILSTYNTTDEGEFLHYTSVDGAPSKVPIPVQVDEKEMSDPAMLHQVGTLSPHSSFNIQSNK
jgi:hypothetical protein